MKIAIQGELGSFSHQAALRALPDATVVPCVLSADAFDRLRKGKVDAIIIPIENSLAGSVVEHYDLLRENAVFIERETVIRIQHHVIGMPGSHLEEIQRAYSHPVALAQCREFFQQHLGIEPIAFYDTAGAVKQIIQLRDRHSAAIAGMQAAHIYGGVVLVQGVEDDAANFTRFLVVREGTGDSRPEGVHKLSVCCRPQHRPGALVALLDAVATAGGNVTKLQSRPVHGRPWHYHFFIDALMPNAAASDHVLDQLSGLGSACKVLGRYLAAPELFA